MKTFFERVAELFTRNWGLKLLSLTLAVVLYHALKPTEDGRQEKYDRTIFQQSR